MRAKDLWISDGAWSVPLGDSVHTVMAELNHVSHQLKITWDGAIIGKCTVWIFRTNLRSFSRNGHNFVLGIKWRKVFGVLNSNSIQELTLLMDGAELQRCDVPSIASVPAEPPATAAAAQAEAAPGSAHSQELRFVEEQHVAESEEVVSVDDYPLDNTFGSESFTTERTVSKESTNELTLEKAHQLDSHAGINAWYVKAEVAAQLGRKTGTTIGQRVTETQTLRFSVGANRRVIYRAVWKRKVRTGEHVFLTERGPLRVPYRLTYGLSLEVRTVEPTSTGAS